MPKKEPLEIIHLLSRAISQAAKLEEVYDIMLDELVNTFGVERASIMHFQPKSETLKIVAARGMDPEIWKNVSIPMGEGASGAAFSKAKPVLIKKRNGDPKYKTHSYMIAPVLSFPMKVGKTPIGVINVTDKKSREPFTQSDLKLLTILSDQVASYMHLCDLLERVKSGERAKMQLEMAHTIQQKLLPATPPNIKGIDVTGSLLPAQKVGADYYDFFSIDGKNLELCIADVSGHDVSSALLAFALRSCIHSEALHNETPAKLVTAMNKLLFQDLLQAEQFISLVYAKFHPQTKTLIYTNAGHNPPLLWKSREKKTEWLTTKDPLLGIQRKETYHQKSCRLSKGDVVIFYTDGLTEAKIKGEKSFGTKGLLKITKALSDRKTIEIQNGILETWKGSARKGFDKNSIPHDDITLLVLKVT